MKSFPLYLLLALSSLLMSCEDVIDLRTQTGPTRLVVEGWINDDATPQTIRLTLSQNYFNNNRALPATGATVTVSDDLGKTYRFVDEKQDGNYVWKPAASEKMGRLGGKYTLNVAYASETYQAETEIKRVPTIDSLTYYYDKPTFVADDSPKEGYVAEFYARDFTGAGDCYWIKTYKNGQRYDRSARDLSIAYDAGFSPGAATDGLIFLLPVRRSINSDRLFQENDSIRVELLSITQSTYSFIRAVREESSNQGLFATAPSNVPTNILNTRTDGPRALGWFGGSSISRFSTVFRKENARPKP
ncbi:hypothetical protein BWI93_19915 [Siphonobacter sp. BAB-5385]|uniref:DUF4249 domain-containing protein n=1 Tax=unclassified Siphonobacter TaxID=2635712 RepID=UPI000B9DEC8B|nr:MULTISPECIES: DUF4249 domain-containing protein [unclassified Siphonobacter]OZI06441.1 hypothetical protein BWI93_19915 [Siphonobacter sp. BAB-5385]PMD98190.1 hypothetical protein BWI97_05785 [Siphonobacter sp. BAB-5405]